ncbi:unnamed protein product [Ambrosiozyma monospora]|uniref:Unnamed protein product n=1 Tax=Ambrosiozyma monospora TaxID=43982 RepID=A0ACB5SXK5_AMBMO|nr:unnamed protein product [Ambrosiozyma monospora]
MKVLVVYAHPEPKSLNGSLFKVTIEELKRLGHEVKTSDLYAMKWKAGIDADDYPEFDKSGRLDIAGESGKGYNNSSLTKDVLEEQEKLKWADLLILQFPMWWFSMPAILKGWIDRVFTNGLAYGVGYSDEKPHGERYGEGSFKGKRAMLSITIGGSENAFSETGLSGDIFDLLYPIQHGILYYTGYSVLNPFLVHGTFSVSDEAYAKTVAELRERLKNLETEEPIAFRTQNGGDYDLKTLKLKPEAFDPKVRGLKIHLKK